MSEALLGCDQEGLEGEQVDSAALALVEHGWQLSQWLDTARTSQWMCDVTIRTRGDLDTPGMWQELTCHSSVLAAVSPVLRHALADLDHLLEPGDGPGVVIISELSMADLLPLFYSGQVSRRGHSLICCHQKWREGKYYRVRKSWFTSKDF